MTHDRRDIVVQSEALSQAAAEWLGARCELIVCQFDDPRFVETIARARGLVVRTETQVTSDLLDAAPRLIVVGRAGVGIDNIDVAACRERRVEVVYTPHASTQAVVEYVFWLIGDAIRPRPALQRAVDRDAWWRLRTEAVGTHQLNELTLGLLGLGRIGKALARLAGCAGMRVVYNDLIEIDVDDRQGAEPVTTQDLFEQADVLSIHVDGRASNRGFVGARLLDRMKPGVVLVNSSRGFVVDNGSLARFLRAHPDAMGFLDVHEPEPFTAADPLIDLPNARLYPHLASRTRTATANMSWVVRDVAAVLEGRAPAWPAPG